MFLLFYSTFLFPVTIGTGILDVKVKFFGTTIDHDYPPTQLGTQCCFGDHRKFLSTGSRGREDVDKTYDQTSRCTSLCLVVLNIYQHQYHESWSLWSNLYGYQNMTSETNRQTTVRIHTGCVCCCLFLSRRHVFGMDTSRWILGGWYVFEFTVNLVASNLCQLKTILFHYAYPDIQKSKTGKSWWENILSLWIFDICVTHLIWNSFERQNTEPDPRFISTGYLKDRTQNTSWMIKSVLFPESESPPIVVSFRKVKPDLLDMVFDNFVQHDRHHHEWVSFILGD